MARKQAAGNLRVSWVTTIANIAAPTTSELNAGVDLTPFLRRDGLKMPMKGNVADASDLSSPFNKQAPGTFGGDSWSLGLYRDDTTDTAWTTLAPPTTAAPNGTAGYLVVRRFGGAGTAYASANKLEVGPASVISREMQDTAENENANFMVTLAVTGEPNMTAVIP